MAIPKDLPTSTGTGGNYMKFAKGENRFRVLGDGIAGWIYWTDEGGKRTPVRSHLANKPPKGVVSGDDKIKLFLTLPVWNYNDKQVQVLEITQSGIRNALQSYEDEPAWGDLTGYDIKVFREGDGLETDYNIAPMPKSPLAAEIKEAQKEVNINLEALFEGGNPFEKAEF